MSESLAPAHDAHALEAAARVSAVLDAQQNSRMRDLLEEQRRLREALKAKNDELDSLVSREPGEDDDDGEDAKDKPRSLAQQALRFSIQSLRATPRPRQYLLRDANTAAGRYVRGRVGILAAAGGTGKSYALTQLGVAVATGTTWFGASGWAPERVGRVLGLFAEEDADEIERRVHHCARAAGVTSDEDLQTLADGFTVIPLAGHGVALTTRADDGATLPETSLPAALRELLQDAMVEGKPYDLIILDPLSRFAGADVETDTSAATRFVQVIETLCSPQYGGAAALLSHHTKKKGENDDPDSADLIRGPTALVNAVRWAARLEQQKRQEGAADLLTLRIVKANGVPPQLAPLVLVRDQEHEGALRVATRDEIDSNDAMASKLKTRMQAIDNVGDRVLEILRDGSTLSRNQIVAALKPVKRDSALEAIAALIDGGELVSVGTGNRSGVRLRFPSVPGAGTEAQKVPNPSGSQFPTPPEGGWGQEPKGTSTHGTDALQFPGTESGNRTGTEGEMQEEGTR